MPKNNDCIVDDNIMTAILVDGGFYRKRANKVFGEKSPQERANELENYVKRHLLERINGIKYQHRLYRIFYYDCPPSSKAIFNPITKENDQLDKTASFKWTNEFFAQLKQKRKFALRLGELSDAGVGYYIDVAKTKLLLTGKLKLENLTEKDLSFSMSQKGVDMRIGIDIASLAYKKQVDQIVLIAGDSDFVPAAKLARREGIDFVLDSLGKDIKDNLFEHIDGLNVKDSKFRICSKNKNIE